MIQGVGTDIVQVARMRRSLDRFGERFARRVLCEAEMAQYLVSHKRAHYLARRFAAKEATVKALGTGFRQGVRMQDIMITHDALGKPMIELSGAALARARAIQVVSIHLSLSDEKDYAVAFVVMSA